MQLTKILSPILYNLPKGSLIFAGNILSSSIENYILDCSNNLLFCKAQRMVHMKIDTKEMLEQALFHLSRIEYMKSEDVPDIDLYMDQVTTFMDEQLSSNKRHEEDKILTKTMINNYTKNNLLPPPSSKKYSKEHMILLTFIYYFKNILSLKDIETLLSPVSKKLFGKKKEVSIASLYDEVRKLEQSKINTFEKNILASFEESSALFSDASLEYREYLRLFSLICSLSFDIYAKKLLVEKLIDQLPSPEKEKKKKR